MLRRILSACFLVSAFTTFARGKSVADFLEERKAVLDTENSLYLGSDLVLTTEEEIANDHLMAHKVQELDEAFEADNLPSSMSFFKSKPQIDASNVFKFIRGLPKGAALHLHEFAITSVDWVVANITYRDNLYTCYQEAGDKFSFGWFVDKPEDGQDNCTWISAAEMRATYGAANVDAGFKNRLSIVVDNPETVYPNVNTVWAEFAKRFGTLMTLLGYKEIAFDYFYQGMQEFYDDGVQYMEVRSVFPILCGTLDVACNPLNFLDSVKVFKEAADRFAADHPSDWCGLKMIYAPSRKVPPEQVSEYFTNAVTLTTELPDFVLGFDLVGQEDLGNPLIDFIDPILNGLEQNPDLKVFFHAGETDWQGSSTDLNIIDALLLNATRMGHGYAIAKHPEAKKMAIDKNIPIEVNPISNQVLGLVRDLRNHPAAPLIQESFPIVISSDDPGLWDAQGVSYDYYSAFMALAGKSMDLKLLKKLVQNSLQYSTLSGDEFEKCVAIHDRKWNDYMINFQPAIFKI